MTVNHIAIALFIFLSCSVQADVSLEQSRLSKLIRELALVRSYVERIQNEVPLDANQRLSFRYDILVSELVRLEKAVRDHIELQNSLPRDHWNIPDVNQALNE